MATQSTPPDAARQVRQSATRTKRSGQVVSAKMQKTIVVEVTRRVSHPVYKRTINKRNKFYAHDEERSAQVGDVVKIMECRPLSKLKRWRLGEVIRKAVQVAVAPEAVDLDIHATHLRIEVARGGNRHDRDADVARGGR